MAIVGRAKIQTHAHEISRRRDATRHACVCISSAPQSPSPKLETTRSQNNKAPNITVHFSLHCKYFRGFPAPQRFVRRKSKKKTPACRELLADLCMQRSACYADNDLFFTKNMRLHIETITHSNLFVPTKRLRR